MSEAPKIDQPSEFLLDSTAYTNAPKFYSDAQLITGIERHVTLIFGLYQPISAKEDRKSVV